MSDMRDKIAKIIAEQALVEASEIKDHTTVEDLGLDSLAQVEVVFAIEEAFDISIPYNANDPSESDFKLGDFASIVAGVAGLVEEKDTA